MRYNQLLGVAPELREQLDANWGLPVIRGQWMLVDPYNTGERPDNAFTSFYDAYDACVSGRGDGIMIFSGGTGTSSQTTSYLPKTIGWTKHGITVVGVDSGVGYFGRSRISSPSSTMNFSATTATHTAHTIVRATGSWITDGWVVGSLGTVGSSGGTSNANNGLTITVTVVTALTLTFSETFTAQTAAEAGTTTVVPYMVNLMTISGSNNRFINVNFINSCLSVLALGAVSVTGNRNRFDNCHFNGADNTSRSAQTTDYDLTLSASECVFNNCYLGNNNAIRAATNGNLVLGVSTTQIGQNYFNDCHFVSYSATTTRGAILVTNAATLGGFIEFNRCKFLNWNSGAETAIATIIIGATPNNLGILLDRCASVGYSAVGANNDTWFTTDAASAAGTGTLAKSIS